MWLRTVFFLELSSFSISQNVPKIFLFSSKSCSLRNLSSLNIKLKLIIYYKLRLIINHNLISYHNDQKFNFWSFRGNVEQYNTYKILYSTI